MKLKNINYKKLAVRFMQIFIIFVAILAIAYLCINLYVNKLSGEYIVTLNEVKPSQAVLVLGAHVFKSGNLSPILQDRVEIAIELYKKGKVKKILMSGDHGRESYDEVNAMKNYAIKKGVPKQDIFMDHAGFSTYESIYRAKYIFGISDIVISTQKYHLKRAIFLAKAFDINVYGVNADKRPYMGMNYYKFRETFAVCKDLIYTIFKVKPTYLGEKIDINGNGNVTEG